VDEHRTAEERGAGDALTPRRRPVRGLPAPAQPRLPQKLRRRLEASGDAWLQANFPGCTVDEPSGQWLDGSRAGWFVTAAAAGLAVAGWWPELHGAAHDLQHGISPFAAEAERGRLRLIDGAGPGLGRWTWAHESGLPADVHGDVVWDDTRQEGYLTLSGLEPSRGTGRQYQLWIFDDARDDRYPVDGGLFDVPADGATVTVRMRPALRIARPTAFAVTLEPAGGVVVSDRRHLVALARTSGR
jgi:hypothetical protein